MGIRSVFHGVRLLFALPLALVAANGCADVSVIGDEGTVPDISSIEPSTGPSEGGTPVVITGKLFEKGAKVRFGGELAPKVKWVDENTLSAVTPPGLGSVSVTVENPGHVVDTLEHAFTYEGVASGCAVVSTTPDIGAADVPVVGELRLKFSAAL